MKKTLIFLLIFALVGCSAQPSVDPILITLPDKPYLTNKEWANPQQVIQVENSEDYTITQQEHEDQLKLCVQATQSDEKLVSKCEVYTLFTLRNDYDYQNSLLSNILVEYLSEHDYLNEDIVYFYYNTVTQEEVAFNMQELMVGASTTKLPMIMEYTDLINEGKLDKDEQLYFHDYLYEESGDDLTNYYTMNDYVPIEFMMKHTILNSDNSSINVLMANFMNYSDVPFRELFSDYYRFDYDQNFYVENLITGNLMLSALKKLYQDQKLYKHIIEDMKMAFPDRYMKINQYPFEIAHKYGDYEEYSHDYGIIYTPSPILVGVFTKGISYQEVLGESEYLIADLVNIMVEYTIVNEKN